MFDPKRPYNELPPLPPVRDVETKAVLKRCTPARTALAELKIAGQLIPDQSVLINSIPILETKDSSAIENIVTTTDALFREVTNTDESDDPVAREALRYRTALHQGFLSLREHPLTTRTAVDICRTITAIDLDIRRMPGTTLTNTFTGEVIYTPPEGETRLRDLLGNWERFLNDKTDLDPLVRMAILHYQFEAIHPFPDGNGRTGRILNILALVQEGLIDLPTLYLSRHIVRTKADYYGLLQRVTTHQEWEPWILYMLTATEVTSIWTNNKIRSIRRLMNHTAEHIRKGAPKIYSRELAELIFSFPYCRITNLVERGIAKRQAASTYLKTLVDLGVLVEEKVGREKLFLHRKYLDLLSSDEHDFAPYPSAKGASPAGASK
jgi:Fic family protein